MADDHKGMLQCTNQGLQLPAGARFVMEPLFNCTQQKLRLSCGRLRVPAYVCRSPCPGRSALSWGPLSSLLPDKLPVHGIPLSVHPGCVCMCLILEAPSLGSCPDGSEKCILWIHHSRASARAVKILGAERRLNGSIPPTWRAPFHCIPSQTS